jgi:hypothetical protein
MDVPSAVGLAIFDAANIGIQESANLEGKAYPNPAKDIVNIEVEGEGVAQLTITDIAGKIAMNSSVTLEKGKTSVNIAGLETGMYIFTVVLENGKTAQFNVAKK